MAKSAELLPLHRPKEALPASSGQGQLMEASPALPRTGYLAPPPALAAGPDLTSLLQALSRRWLLAAFLSILLGGATAAAAWFLFPIRYTAYSQLRIAMTPPWLVVRNADTSERRGEFLTYQRTRAAWIKDYFVLSAALQGGDEK